MFLFSLSNTLEVYTMGRTRRALRALLDLRPPRALVRREGREVEVEADAVRVGETVILKPGEAIPVDGTVTLGESLVDQANLTGESVPVAKRAGDKLFAGTLNQQGSLEMIATRVAANSALARIVALVQEAQEKKSRAEEIAEVAGRYYTVVVIIGAALMLFIPPLALGYPWRDSFYRAMTLLVVPLRLVIATPATVLSAIANAARNGILFKGGKHLERWVACARWRSTDRHAHVADSGHRRRRLPAHQDRRCSPPRPAEKRSPHPLPSARAAAESRLTSRGLLTSYLAGSGRHAGRARHRSGNARAVRVARPPGAGRGGQARAPVRRRGEDPHDRARRRRMGGHRGSRPRAPRRGGGDPRTARSRSAAPGAALGRQRAHRARDRRPDGH
jgi:hypothetical protein